MISNHTAVIIILACIVGCMWNLSERNYGWVGASIILAALCGLSIFYQVLQGQPIW